MQPVDLADLRARALAAREYKDEAGGVTFTLRLPTRHEMLMAAREILPADQQQSLRLVDTLLMQRELLVRAVVRWAGAVVGQIVPDAADADQPLPCNAETVRLWLDAQPDSADGLLARLSERIVERQKRTEAAAGN